MPPNKNPLSSCTVDFIEFNRGKHTDGHLSYGPTVLCWSKCVGDAVAVDSTLEAFFSTLVCFWEAGAPLMRPSRTQQQLTTVSRRSSTARTPYQPGVVVRIIRSEVGNFGLRWFVRFPTPQN